MNESLFPGSKTLLSLLILFASSHPIVVTSNFHSHCTSIVFGGGKTVILRYCLCGNVIALSLS